MQSDAASERVDGKNFCLLVIAQARGRMETSKESGPMPPATAGCGSVHSAAKRREVFIAGTCSALRRSKLRRSKLRRRKLRR